MARRAGGCLVPEEEEADDEQDDEQDDEHDDEQDGGIMQRNRIGINRRGTRLQG